MSDKSQSLPINDESVEEKNPTFQQDPTSDFTKEASKQVADDASKSESSDKQSFDDTVFLALHRRNNITNDNAEAKTGQDTQVLHTVEVVSPISTSTLDDESTAEYFPAAMISDERSLDSNKVFLTPAVQDKDEQVLLWKESNGVVVKKRRYTDAVEGSEIGDEQDKDLFMSVISGNTLAVSCKKNHGILHKSKLGSGNKGKCIKFEDEWYTPSKFENISGLAMSKDWKRSIRYGGRTMQYLINKGYVRPHAATCTCSVCSEDETVTGPVRYFTPKLRRKRSATSSISLATPITWDGESATNIRPMTAPLVQGSAFTQEFVMPITTSVLSPVQNTKAVFANKRPSFLSLMNSADIPSTSEMESLIQAISENDTTERRLWSNLEEKANLMMEKLVKLQETITQAKSECIEKRNKLFKRVLTHLEKQKNGAVQAFKFDSPLASPLQLKKSLRTSRDQDNETEKLDDDNQEEEYAEICRACGRQAISECTGCHKATYCSTECQEKDWHAGHRTTCRGLTPRPPNRTTVTVSLETRQENTT